MFGLLPLLAVASVETELAVLEMSPDKSAEGDAFHRHLRRLADEALQRRRTVYQEIKTAEQAIARQRELRAFFLQQLGPMSERSPLNARTVGTLSGSGYRIEKVIYASQPGHHITALLYLPTTPPPYPAVLIPCGHSFNGKAAEGYQRAGINFARHGIAALCYDPIGQGERYQTLQSDGGSAARARPLTGTSKKRLEPVAGRPQFTPVEEHNAVGVGSILVGRSAATYRIFDGFRSLDYLASRSDIDASKLGCSGNSGGGTLTAYLMALDDRIHAAAPACYLTTFDRLLATNGPQDAEQNIHGQIAFGMDQGDYVMMRAPKPTLLLAGTHDRTFDIAGTWDIFRESKRFFARFDRPERIDMVEADAPHGYTPQLRIGAVQWMRRWLLGIDTPVSEPDFPIHTDAELLCTPRGQVMLMPGERSVFELNRELERSFAPERRRRWANPREAVASVRDVAGIRPLADLPAPAVRGVGTIERPGYTIRKLVLSPETDLPLPGLLFEPVRRSGDPVLYVHGEGKTADAAPGGLVERLVLSGRPVLTLDVRGTGETRRQTRAGAYSRHEQDYFLAYLLGRSLVGMQAEDVLVAARYLANQYARSSVQLNGVGEAGVPALHAAALEPQLFETVVLRRTLGSWRGVVHDSTGEGYIVSTVAGALRVYDLPDLHGVLAGKLTLEEPAGPGARSATASTRAQ